MSPDLQEVPQGFKVSSCKRYLLRPNGKPVPRGVHVGPGFRLLKPSGETLPDGEGMVDCLAAAASSSTSTSSACQPDSSSSS
jgi:hypothetical protein